MKRVLSSCSAALAAACLSSCTAVHPLPDDYADTTVMIVRKVRCEARDAVTGAILRYLKIAPDKDKINHSYIKKFESKSPPDITTVIRGKDITEDAWDYLNKYYNGAIAYDFELDITNENERAAGIGIFDGYRGGARFYDLGGGVKQTNQAKRQFKIVDSVASLMGLHTETIVSVDTSADDKLKVHVHGYCDLLSGEKKSYPITGDIGMKETVATFVSLYDSAAFHPIGDDDKLSRFTDELVFTTITSGRFNPKIQVNPVSGDYASPGVSLTNNASRTDKHKVVVAIEIPVATKTEDSKKAALAKGLLDPALADDSARKALRSLELKRTEGLIDTLQKLDDRAN
jgi:hypothetical protein